MRYINFLYFTFPDQKLRCWKDGIIPFWVWVCSFGFCRYESSSSFVTWMVEVQMSPSSRYLTSLPVLTSIFCIDVKLCDKLDETHVSCVYILYSLCPILCVFHQTFTMNIIARSWRTRKPYKIMPPVWVSNLAVFGSLMIGIPKLKPWFWELCDSSWFVTLCKVE